MTDETERAGLGKVIYSVDEKPDEETKCEERTEVQEADEESFPASDPPGFAGGSNSEST